MCADRLTVVMIHLERVSDQQCECIFFFGTYKKHGKFQPASVAKSVASRTGVSCAVRGEGGSGCRRDCWLAVSDWLVDERPGNRIAVGGWGGAPDRRRGRGPHSLVYQWVPGLLPVGKAAGALR